MMRLAYLSTDPGIAFGGAKGAAVHVGEVIGALAAEGTDVLALVAGVAPGAAAPAGAAVEALPSARDDAVDAAQPAADTLVAWVESRLRRFRPTAIYERLALTGTSGAGVGRRLGVPHLLELNAPLPEEATRYRGLRDLAAADRLERGAIRGSDVVFAVSPPLATYAVGRGARRVEILQNAVDVERFVPTGGNPGRPIAVFAGSLRPWHGIDTIAAAWRLLGCEAPRLLIVGDGPTRDLLSGLGARVTGRVPPAEVPALLAGADIGLAPYGGDAPDYFSPIKLFEYLAAGLATVVADLPAVTAVVDADTAVVVPRGDARALADAVAALTADPAERRRLARNGRALVADRHTWRHRARRIIEVADELAAEGRA